ncbi:hypothetical protein [Melghirimyces algeriensis]|uniref:Uncharacterized protein n=1 Tax=Melghirimyces algeriensis TaxID=910412 RepID=A0A521F9F6_9BACL|nr:hypothetical protein [Melghirimyces algeriensis]SMO92251.1 hypothetical protein SAMN06264849_11454 [Melghirimyces algeriensis]
MSDNKLKSYEWQWLEISKWNTRSFQAYLKDRHKEVYGIDYVPRSWRMEAGMIKNFINEHGTEVLREFIDECLSSHKPTKQYPGLNFWFIYTYLRSQYLPRVLSRRRAEKEKRRKKRPQPLEMSREDLRSLL